MYTSKGITIYCGSCLENGTLPVDKKKTNKKLVERKHELTPGFRVAQSLVFCVVSSRSLFVLCLFSLDCCVCRLSASVYLLCIFLLVLQ
jgi:hypothetical protein